MIHMNNKPISYEAYLEWARDYFGNFQGNLRFGQAFFNHFYPKIKEIRSDDPELFYTHSIGDANEIILERYVDLTNYDTKEEE